MLLRQVENLLPIAFARAIDYHANDTFGLRVLPNGAPVRFEPLILQMVVRVVKLKLRHLSILGNGSKAAVINSVWHETRNAFIISTL